jgi:hypothetical protein
VGLAGRIHQQNLVPRPLLAHLLKDHPHSIKRIEKVRDHDKRWLLERDISVAHYAVRHNGDAITF